MQNDFDSMFKDTQKKVAGIQRVAIIGSVVTAVFGAGFVGLICWAIYRLVTHFTQ